MDKTQEKALDFMLHKSYLDTVHRAIAAYVLMAISEIKETLTIDKNYLAQEIAKYPVQMQPIALVAIKNKCFLSLLGTNRTRKHLESILDDVVKRKDDLVVEIIKQYGMDKDSQVNVIHDKMSRLFSLMEKKIRVAIQRGDYKYIYDKWRSE